MSIISFLSRVSGFSLDFTQASLEESSSGPDALRSTGLFSSEQFKSELNRERIKCQMKDLKVKSFQKLPATDTLIHVATYLAPEDAREELSAMNEIIRESHIRNLIVCGRDDYAGINKTSNNRLIKALRSNREVVQSVIDTLKPGVITPEEVAQEINRVKDIAKAESTSFAKALYLHSPVFFEILLKAKHPLAFKALREIQNSSGQDELRSVVKMYGEIGNKEAFEALKGIQSCEQDEIVLGYLAEAYGQIGTPQAFEALRAMVTDSNKRPSSLRDAIIEGYGQIGTPEALDELKKMMKDLDLSDSLAHFDLRPIVKAFGEFNTPDVFLLLKDMQKHWDSSIRNYVAGAYGKFKTDEAFEALKEMQNDSESWVRRAVAKSYGEFKTDEAFEALKEMQNDSSQEVQAAVALAYAQFGTPEAFSKLDEMRHSRHLVVRKALVKAYGTFGGEDALPILETMQNDKDLWVDALNAICRLKHSPSPDAFSGLMLYRRRSNRLEKRQSLLENVKLFLK